ncbi:Transaldolase [Bienertia sinuspersici]
MRHHHPHRFQPHHRRRKVQALGYQPFEAQAIVDLGDITRKEERVQRKEVNESEVCFAQASAAAQAGASVIQIFVGRIRDWARNHSGDSEIDAALKRGEDPGLALMTKAYNYIHKYGHKSKLMAAAVRNKQDLYSLLGVDYIIAPLKVLESLKESATSPDEKYAFTRRLSPHSAAAYEFSKEEVCFSSCLHIYLHGLAKIYKFCMVLSA